MSSYSNKEPILSNVAEDFDIQDIVDFFKRYKISIVNVTVLVFLLMSFYAIFKSNVYMATMTVQIDQSDSKNGAGNNDILSSIMGGQTGSLDNEIGILQSRNLIKDALGYVEIGTRYFEETPVKSIELYRDVPFEVNYNFISENAKGVKFQILQTDDEHFRLEVKPTFIQQAVFSIRSAIGSVSAEDRPIAFSKVFKFGSMISHPDFQLSVSKKVSMKGKKYFFTIIPNEDMIDFVQLSLGVGPLTPPDGITTPGNILALTFRDNVPKRAEDILSALSKAYIYRNIDIKEESARQRLRFIDEQLLSINASLEKSSTHIKDYKTDHIILDLNDKAHVSTAKIDQLETKLSDLDMQESVLKNLLNYLNQNKEISGIDVGASDIATSPILSLIEKIQAANTTYSSLSIEYTEQHPSVIQVKKQIAFLKSSLRGTIESSLRGIDQRKATLQEIIKSNKRVLEDMPAQEQQLTELTRSFMVNTKVFEYLLEKRIETAIAKSSTVAGAHVIDGALTNVEQPVEPKRVLLIIIGFILGLILGIGQALIRNFISNTVHNIRDITKRTNLPLYAVLPVIGSKKSLYQDAMRVLMTKLEYGKDKPKLITMTSSVKGEGRTTTIFEFAKVIGDAGKKVILLDLDMSGNGINKILRFGSPGIEDYLAEKVRLDDIVHPIAPNTDVAVISTVIENPYQLIISDAFKEMLNTLKNEYDYILMEAPPAGIVADALSLMRLSDISFMVFKAQHSKKDFVVHMNRFVVENDLNENVGIILTGIPLNKIRPWFGR